MAQPPLRIGIVGYGLLGAYHADCYRVLDGCQVVGVADANPAARDRATQAGLPTFATPDELIATLTAPAGHGLAVLDVCTPTPTHAAVLRTALDAGVRHAICEKPLARTPTDARGIVELARATGAEIYVGHVVRFFPEFVAAREAVLRGDVGRPAIVRTSRRTVCPKAEWYRDPNQSGGVLLDMLVHDFDWLRWCFGEVRRVYARSVAFPRSFTANRAEEPLSHAAPTGHDNAAPSIDYALVTLRFENDVIAHVEGSWAHRRFATAIEVAGDGGLLTFQSQAIAPFRAERRDGTEWSPGRRVVTGGIAGAESPHFQEIAHFVECIRSGTPPRVTVEDGWRAVEIAAAAELAAKTGRVVTLAEVREG